MWYLKFTLRVYECLKLPSHISPINSQEINKKHSLRTGIRNSKANFQKASKNFLGRGFFPCVGRVTRNTNIFYDLAALYNCNRKG